MGVADQTVAGVSPLPSETSPVWNSQTFVNFPTLYAVIWVSGLYFCALSWPWKLSQVAVPGTSGVAGWLAEATFFSSPLPVEASSVVFVVPGAC
ncbi:Uncharacterised protein [Enterobacter hormaechei]|nr:Uncharacterised protein [Enterobacter hormaechei]